MRHPSHRRLCGGIGAAAGTLVLSLSGFAIPASAATVNQTGGVSPTAAMGTPALTTNGAYEAVRELKQCGSTMYAVGQFTTITQNGTTLTRNNIFSFSATAPYTLTSWAPNVNGVVDTIAFNGANCSDAYIGGNFTSVNGTSANRIAEISTSSGGLVSSFAHNANGEVFTMILSKSHLLTGGAFTTINGSSTRYYVSLNAGTGDNDGYAKLNISGTYQYQGVVAESTKVYNQQASHGGSRVMVEGVFTSVGGHARQQAFQEWLGPTGVGVTGWSAPILNDHCVTAEPFYVRAAAWAPDDGTVYTASTGSHLYLNSTTPLTGPCDATIAFSGAEQSVSPEWTNYTGCDSLYAAVADTSAVYVAGHPRWSNNPNGCNAEGAGAVPDRGLQGLNPATGRVELNSNGTNLYTMSRSNADDEIITSAGMWIASTNRFDSGMCGNVQGVSGICFLPYN
ncbi:MAG TPA: hypothetical protein VGI74_01390 [Streptosporangiaceae bacterium]